ncbi:hypothetical protein FKB34_15545 [Glycocaulis profundi]|nr:hypothetical protein FKB34_15545 [Glycocaulis profundi]
MPVRGLAALLGLRPAPRSGPPPALMVAALPRSRNYCLKGRRPRLKAGQKVSIRPCGSEDEALEAWSDGRPLGRLARRDAEGLRPLLAAGLNLEARIAEPGAGQGRPIRIAVTLRLA